MRKKVIGGIAATVVAAAIAVNVNISAKNDTLSEVMLSNVEALADNESNPWYLWPFQGLTKDEKPRYVDCQVHIGTPPYVEVTNGKKRVCDNGGNENCTTSLCKP
jgi:hypothetical protein